MENGSVYKVVASGGQNKLAQLIGVLSPNPEETLRKWLEHSSVHIVEEPALVPGMKAADPGVDHVLRAISKKPGFTLVNRLEQSPFERMLTGGE
jgi:hypothetical protein